MDPTVLVLIVLVGGGAFYAGYQVGRFKALSERGPSYEPDQSQPLPGPGTSRRQADAGGSWEADAPAANRAPPPRRSSKPPPAAAGLMGKGD